MEKTIYNLLLSALKEIDPHKVILFGSQAVTPSGPYSDIDLVVVTKSEEYPRSYSENKRHYLAVARAMSKVNDLVPLDLLVYTRPMFAKMIEQQTSFAKDLMKNGKVIYEASD